MQKCEVCRGSGKIFLPLLKEASVQSYEAAVVERHYKMFPCPECSSGVEVSKILIFDCTFMASSYHAVDESYRHQLRRSAAQRIAGKLLGGRVD